MGLISRVSSRTYRFFLCFHQNISRMGKGGKSEKSKSDAVATENRILAFSDASKTLVHNYMKSTPQKLKLIDAYLLYILLTGVMQFVYCCMVGTFPFNAFLSGFISCVTSFILAVCLRLQVNPKNKSQFSGISPERAFADFIFAHILLHLVVINFIG